MKPEDKINIDPVEDLKPIDDLEPLAPVKSPLREAEVLPNAITRIDHYLKAIAGQPEREELPNAITRIDHYLRSIAENGGSLSDIAIFNCSGNIINGATLTLTETLGDIIQAVESGKFPIIIHTSGYIFYFIEKGFRYAFEGIRNFVLDGKTLGQPVRLDTATLTNTSSHSLYCYISFTLPYVTSDDNGKIPLVNNGVWTWAPLPTELPTVSADDNGKILKVVDGVWTAATP